MSISKPLALGATATAATIAAASVGNAIGTEEPSADKPWVVDDGITKAERSNIATLATFGVIAGGVAGMFGSVAGATFTNAPKAPSLRAPIVIGAAIGGAFMGAFAFASGSSSSLEMRRELQPATRQSTPF